MIESETGFEGARNSVESIHERVDALLDMNRPEEAEKLIRQELSEFPEDAYWLGTLARAQLAQNKFNDAQELLFSALSADPDFAWNYFLLSIVSRNLRNFGQELKTAQKAAELTPEEPLFLQRLAEAQLQKGEIKNARETLNQVTKLEPDSIEAFELFGDIEFQLENYAAAEKAYRQALKFDPEKISLLNDLARSLLGQKKKRGEAIDVLFNIVQLDPTDKAITDNLYIAIQEWVDANSFRGKGKKALKELPEPLQYFFNDYKKRSSIFKAWGTFTWTFAWIGTLAAATYLISLVGVR